jgi:PAS domain S-box-containing protein
MTSPNAKSVSHNLARTQQVFVGIWNRLTEPTAAVVQAKERRRTRLLAGALITLIIINVVALIPLSIFDVRLYLIPGYFALAGFLIAYAFSRSAYPLTGGVIALAVLTVIPYSAAIIEPNRLFVLVFMLDSTLLSMLLFRLRITALLVVAEFAAMCAFPFIQPNVDPVTLLLVTTCFAAGSIFVMSIQFIRREEQQYQERQARVIADSELRYRLLAENATDLICRHQLDATFIYISPASRVLLGYEPEDLMGQSPYDYFHPEDKALVRLSHDKVLASNDPDVISYRFRRKDSTYIWFETSSKVIRDPLTGTPWEIITVSRDVTERKTADEALLQTNLRLGASRDTFQRLMQQMPIGVQVFDTEGVCIDCNQTYLEIFGVDNREQVIGKFSIIKHTNDDINLINAFRNALEGDITQLAEVELNFDRANRQFSNRVGRIVLGVTFCPIYDENQQIVSVIALNQNVTERKVAEEALVQTNLRLEASRDTLQRVVQQMPIGIQMFDTNGLCSSVNETHMAIFGLQSREQVVGKFNILEDELAIKVGTEAGYRCALAGEVADVGEVEFDFSQADARFSAASGRRFLSVSFFPIYDENQQVVSVVALNQDITERKLADEALRNLADELLQQKNTLNAVLSATPDHFTIFDHEGRYLYVNPPGLASVGLDIDTVVGKTWRDLDFPATVGERFEREREQVFATGQPVTGFTQFPSVNGVREFQYIYSPVFDSEGRVVLMVSTNRDLTEQRQAEQERFELALQREQVKMLQHLISDTSHDLKTPLATLNNSLYLLKRSISDPERRDHYAEVLQSQVTNLTKILEDMDSMSRLDGASDAFVFEPVDLNDFVRHIVDEHETLALDKAQQLRFEAGDSIPRLLVDQTKLRRAITNLLTNALNYTQEGGQIDARVFRREADVVIEIGDNGTGISQQELALIFDRFYRSEASRKLYSNGSGLGLAISKKIVESHGGTIEVESEIGAGSRFRIILPFGQKTATG